MNLLTRCTCLRNKPADRWHSAWCNLYRPVASGLAVALGTQEAVPRVDAEGMRASMQGAGFEFSPTKSGRARWVHPRLKVHCTRDLKFTEAQWRGALRGALSRALQCEAAKSA